MTLLLRRFDLYGCFTSGNGLVIDQRDLHLLGLIPLECARPLHHFLHNLLDGLWVQLAAEPHPRRLLQEFHDGSLHVFPDLFLLFRTLLLEDPFRLYGTHNFPDLLPVCRRLVGEDHDLVVVVVCRPRGLSGEVQNARHVIPGQLNPRRDFSPAAPPGLSRKELLQRCHYKAIQIVRLFTTS